MGKLTSSIFSCSHDNLLKSWSLTTGRLEQTFIGSERAIYTIHLSPFNPSLLFSGGYDCAIRVWDIKSAQCTHTLKGHTDSIFSLLLLPDGRLVSGSSDKTIKVWNLKLRKCEATLTGHLGGILAMIWVQSMGVVVSASIDHTLKVWSMRDLKCEMTMIGHALPVSSLVLLDDQRVVSASHDKTIRVWSITSTSASSNGPHRKPKCELTVTAHTAPIQAITLLTPDRLVSCSRDMTIKVWNLSFQAPLLTLQGHTKDINSLAVLPDGRLVSASSDCTIRVWSIDLNNNTSHCDLSFSNVGMEGRQFVVYGVSCYRGGGGGVGEEVGIRRSASRGNMSHAASLPTIPATPSTPSSLSAAPSTPISLTPSPAPTPEPFASLNRSRGKSRPSASSSIPPSTPSAPSTSSALSRVDIPSTLSLEQRRLDKLKRARELERLRQLEQTKMLLDDEAVVDEEEARRFASVLSLRPDVEVPDGVRETIGKYRNAHHLNYSDILNDGWYDDGGLIPGVNAAKVGRERGGGRWEGEVTIFDAQSDAALSDIVEAAKRLVRQQETVKGRVQILAQLVSNKLGGLPNDVVGAWERVMKKAVRYRQQKLAAMSPQAAADVDQRLILPVGALIGEGGLTRHRACLFKYLCDLTVQNPEEWCWPSDEAPLSPGMDEEREGGEVVKKGESRDDLTAIRLSRFLNDDPSHPSPPQTAVGVSFDDEKVAESGAVEERERHRLGGMRRSSDSDVEDKGEPPTLHHTSPSPDELAIHCRLIRGQYQYYVPRSRKHKKDANGQPQPPSPTAPISPSSAGIGEDDDRGRERVGGYHAWNVVIINGQHFVVDLIYQPSTLYHESSREAMHYNRGRFGSPKQTGLTNLPVRDVREIEWSEFTQITNMKDGGFGRVEKAKWRGIDVVIKTPLTADVYVIKTFIEEARVLNTLSHPNIVQLIGVCSAKKAIIIEYINGGDVHQWIKSKKNTTAISLKQRLDVLIQCALAMQYLHGCEPPIVHRDLKTLNLLIQVVGEKRVIKVCFPQEDHQVLTSDGFRDFEHFHSALQRGEAVSVACPVRRRASDPLDQLALEYHDVVGLDALVDQSTLELVDMRSNPTVSTHRSSKRGREQMMRAVATDGMDLQLTPEHQLPVGLGAYQDASSDARVPVRRCTAREMLDARVQDGPCEGEGVECASFVCHAAHGVSDLTPHLPLPFTVALGLTTDDQVDAFVELYGYWLGNGELMGDGVDAIIFRTYKDADVDYLYDLLGRLPLCELPPGSLVDRRGGFRKCELADSVDDCADEDVEDYFDDCDGDEEEDDLSLVQEEQASELPHIAAASARVRRTKCSYRIYDTKWFHYFAEQYGHKQWSPSDLLASPTRSRASSSSLSSPLSLGRSTGSSDRWIPLAGDDGAVEPQLSATLADEEPTGNSSSAKWAWWWVWQRLCARRLRLLLRGLRSAVGNQARELDAQCRLEAEAIAARAEQRWADAAAIDERLRTSRQTCLPLTSARIHTASARCCEEYLHMALRAGFTGTTSLKHRVGRTNAFDDTSARPLWQVNYAGAGLDSARPRLVINPSESAAAELGVPQLRHKEIDLLRLASPKKVWCVQVPTADHLIIVRRVKRDAAGQVVETSRPTVIGNCDFGLARNQKSVDGISTQHKDMGTPCQTTQPDHCALVTRSIARCPRLFQLSVYCCGVSCAQASKAPSSGGTTRRSG